MKARTPCLTAILVLAGAVGAHGPESPSAEQIAVDTVCRVVMTALPPEVRLSPGLSHSEICARCASGGPILDPTDDTALIRALRHAGEELTHGLTESNERRIVSAIGQIISTGVTVTMSPVRRDTKPNDGSAPPANEWLTTLSAHRHRLTYESRVSRDRVTSVKQLHTVVAQVRQASAMGTIHSGIQRTGEADDRPKEIESPDQNLDRIGRERLIALTEQRIEFAALLAARVIYTSWLRSGAVTSAPDSDQDSPSGTDARVPDGTSSGQDFVGSRRSTVFHSASCTHARRIRPGNRVRFETAEDARRARRQPCRTCKPDRTGSDRP